MATFAAPLVLFFGCGQRAVDPGLVVMVMYFQNNTNDRELDVLGKGIADMMLTDLTAVDGLTIVERARLQDLVNELKLQQTEYFDPATAGKLGKGLGATHAITGALTEFDPQLRIDIRLVDVPTSNVEMGDHVVGPKDQFFGLQQQLSEKFVTALGETLKPPPPQGGVRDVSVVLDYARGLDYLDRGDFASAERVLAGVVGQSPEFDLARKRHDEALAQLEAARKRREELLGEGQRALLERMDAALAGDVTRVSPGKIDEWIGYRELRGQLFLKVANAQLADPPTRLTFGKVVPNDRREAFREAMTTYFENMLALTAEMRAWRGAGRGLPTFLDLPDEDEKQASTLGLSSPKILRTPDEIAIELAQQVCAGKLPDAFLGSAPTLIDLDPVTVPSMMGELDRALADVATFQPRYVERATMRLLAVYGDCLVALGRKDEAVRKWQEGLDRFPTASPSEYGDLEQRIRENL